MEVDGVVISLLVAFSVVGPCCMHSVLPDTHSLRLPQHLVPFHYRIKLIPFLMEGNFTTHGEVWVDLDCRESSDYVVFHINNMTIDQNSVTITDIKSGDHFTVMHQAYDIKTQKYSLQVQPCLKAGHQYLLHIKFTSVLNNLLQGLYRSSYIDEETGQRRWLASSQFSPTDARRAFPCWDEPLFKARFTVSLGRPSHMKSWSNMPINSTIPLEGMDGWVWDNFQTTLPMSTYLVAFMVSNLQSSGVITLPSGLKFQVIARKAELSHTRYVASIGPKALMYLEEYFKIKFPLPKLDLVGVPDFGFYAMENWGFITFRESVMLYDAEEESLMDHDLTAHAVCHELSHQWFGNLVTPIWWEDLWLKEGFATYIGHLTANHLEPEWMYDERFVLDTLLPALEMDSLKSSHPISVFIEDPKDITQIFDEISYKKGASIIRMMHHFMTETQFRAGLTDYLQQFAYNNTRQDQLWQVLTDHRQGSALPANTSVKDVMDSWTLQVGYPVITVTRNYEEGTATFTQHRFLVSEREDRSLWWVPLSYVTQADPKFNDTRPKLWLSNRQRSTSVANLSDHNWLLVNINQTGFYRVNYDEKNWALLTADFENLPELTRAQLLDEALSLARAGLTPYSVALNLTKQLYNDHSYFTWTAIKSESTYIHDRLIETPSYNLYREYVLKLLRVNEMNLTLDPSSVPSGLPDKLHHWDIIKLACRLDLPSLVAEIQALTTRWMAGDQPRVPPDLKSTVYCTAVANGDAKVWHFFWTLYLRSKAATERVLILQALGCSRDLTILTRYLNMILDENSDIRKQDGAIVYISIALNKIGYRLAFDFLAKNWHDIQEYFGLGFRLISSMIFSLSRFLHTPQQLEQLKALRANHTADLGSTGLDLRHTIELVTDNVMWSQNYHHQITDWLLNAVTSLR